MKKTILVISDDENSLALMTARLSYDGHNVLPAVLSEHKKTSNFPYIADVIKNNPALDGILLRDGSAKKGAEVFKQLYRRWEDAGQAMASVEDDLKRTRPKFSAKAADPVQESIGLGIITKAFEDADREIAAERKEELAKYRKALEGLMMTNPPSDKRINLIKEMRGNPCYKDVPIIVDYAFEAKVPEFSEAGATAVVTSFDYDLVNAAINLLYEKMNLPTKPLTPLERLQKGAPGADNTPPR